MKCGAAVLLAFLARSWLGGLWAQEPGASRMQISEKKSVSLFVDDFESSDPSEAWKFQKEAPQMLMTALFHVVGASKFVQIAFVERAKLTNVLKERELPDKLPKVFDAKTVTALQAAQANYVIFCQYRRVKPDTFRVEARLVKVETAAAVTAVQDNFSADDVEPFQGLAQKLKPAIYKALQVPLADNHFKLVVCRFEPTPPNEKLPPFVDESLLGRLQRLHLSSINSVAPNVTDCPGAAHGNPEVTVSQLFVAGHVIVEKGQDGRRIYHLLVKIYHPERGLAAQCMIECEETALMGSLPGAADELGQLWEFTAIEWAENPTGP